RLDILPLTEYSLTYGDNHHLTAHHAERSVFNGRNGSGIGPKAAASAVGRRRKRRRAGGARSGGQTGVLLVDHSTGHDADRHPDWSVGGAIAGRTYRGVLEGDSTPRTIWTGAGDGFRGCCYHVCVCSHWRVSAKAACLEQPGAPRQRARKTD